MRVIAFCLAALLGSAVDQSKADGGLPPQGPERPETSVQVSPSNGIQTEPAGAEQKQALEQERSTTDALRRELASIRTELEATRAQALAAQALAQEQRNLAEHERAINATVAQTFLAVRKDIDALKTSSAREENLRRELAATREELAAMRRVGENAGVRPDAVADPMKTPGPAFEAQRQKAEGLSSDLALAQREIERLQSEAIAARKAAEASLAGTSQALEEERRKAGLLEHDLAEARQFIETLEASAKLGATTQAGTMQAKQLAETAARQAGEALAREHERAGALASQLETARRERDAAKEEFARVSAAFNEAWEQEREKANALTRDLAAARKEIEALKRRADSRTSRTENEAKARPADGASARAGQRKSVRKAGRQEVGGAEARKPRVVRLVKIVLPDALLPTRPPAEGFQ